MGNRIHGWRKLVIVKCSKTDKLVLKGMAGMHQHTNPSERAECRNLGATGMWMTPEAKRRKTAGKTHKDAVVPRFDCTCGYYGYRTFEAAVRDGVTNQFSPYFFFHVSCIERVIIHEEGFRAERYHIDYALRPDTPQLEMPVWALVDLQYSVPYFHGKSTVTMGTALETVSNELGFPILAKDDPRGCRECQVVNGWVDPEYVTLAMTCSCYSPAQDELHGRLNRLHIYVPKVSAPESRDDGVRLWRCTCCGTMKPGPTPERNDGKNR